MSRPDHTSPRKADPLDTNLPTPDPDSEWATKRADQLHVGDYLSGDLLPLGQHSEVLFTRFFERDRSEWFFIAFVQWDGFHDSTTFLASAPVRVRVAEPTHIEDPTGLAYSRADDEPTTRLTVFMSGMGGPDTDVVLTRPGRRVEPHTGALTEQGLVDETPAEASRCVFEVSGRSTLHPQLCDQPILWSAGFGTWQHADGAWRGHDALPSAEAVQRLVDEVAEQVDD